MVLELPLAGEPPSMRFGDGRVEGYGGCNRFTASYLQDSVGARAIAIRRTKELGFTGKQDIERIGVAEFNRLCRVYNLD